MRYEKPECVLLGKAEAVILGGILDGKETVESDPRPGLIGYDE